MNALSKLFETLHLSRRETASRRSHRRRRTRQHRSYLSCETLEPKQLLAADVGVQFDDIVLETTDPSTVAIEGRFEESKVSSGTIVRFETNAPLSDPSFYVELTDNTPQTNANFLSYVNSGAYDNSIFHRSVDNFVIQGGGFSAPLVDANRPGSDPVSIPTTGTVDNEPFNSNDRGTIAMAKLGGQPDSATSQFFFNLSDNDFLNSDNGGYTQFGSVLGSGMTVVDTLGTATVWRADQYYANTAMQELPLWNLNADNIVTPNDFVKINNVEVATETDSDLFTYEVSSSDAAKLTASFDGNGDLVLTPNASASGSVSVTVTATSKLDNLSDSQTFSVQLNAPVLTAIEEVGNTFFNRDDTGNLFADGNAIYLGTSQLTTSAFSSYTFLAAEDFGQTGGKQLLLRHTSGFVVTWQTNDQWTHSGNLPTVDTNDVDSINTKEVAFGIDIDQDGDIGLDLSNVESTGTRLQTDTAGLLFADGNAIYLGTSQLTTSTFSSYTFLAAEDFGQTGGKQLLLRHTSGFVVTWQTNDQWTHSGNLPTVDTNDVDSINTKEVAFGIDIDQDGDIGLDLSNVESTGTRLQTDTAGLLFADGNAIYLGTSQLTTSTFSSYTFLAAEDFGQTGGKQLLLRHTSGFVVTWQTNDQWTHSGNLPTVDTNDVDSINTKEVAFGIDIDQDGDIGLDLSNVESTGTRLQTDTAGLLFADGNAIYLGTSQLTTSTFSSYTFLAAEDFGQTGGKQLLLRHTSGFVVTWQTNDQWTHSGNLPTVDTNDVDSINTKEVAFGIDIDQDGDIGINVTAPIDADSLESVGNTTLKIDSEGLLYADDQAIYIGPTHIATDTFSAYTIVAAEDFDNEGGKQLLLRHNTGFVVTWLMNSGWRHTGNLPTVPASDILSINAKELSFGIDVDQDGDIGQTKTAPEATTIVESVGNTTLEFDSSNLLYAADLAIYIGSTHIARNSFSGYTIVAAEDFGNEGGKQLLLKHATGFIVTWQMNDSWQHTGNLPTIGSADTSSIELKEAAFGIDLLS